MHEIQYNPYAFPVFPSVNYDPLINNPMTGASWSWQNTFYDPYLSQPQPGQVQVQPKRKLIDLKRIRMRQPILRPQIDLTGIKIPDVETKMSMTPGMRNTLIGTAGILAAGMIGYAILNR